MIEYNITFEWDVDGSVDGTWTFNGTNLKLTTGDKNLYLKVTEFQEKWIEQLKEHIAKEIEAELCDTPNHGDFHQDWTHEVNTAALKLAANIVRGKNDKNDV